MTHATPMDCDLLSEARAALRVSVTPQLLLCGRSGQVLEANTALRQWLEAEVPVGMPRAGLLPLFASRLAASTGADLDLAAWLEAGPRQPLRRALLPGCPRMTQLEPGALCEWLSLWVPSAEGGAVLLRVRPLPAEEQAFLRGGSEALRAGCVVEGLPMASGVLSLDLRDDRLSLIYRDAGLARLLGGAAAGPVRSSAWLAAGVPAFEQLLIRAALASRRSGLFVLPMLDSEGRSRRWRLGISPRLPADEGEAHLAQAVLSLHPKDAVPVPSRRFSRLQDLSREVLFRCSAEGVLSYVDEAWSDLTGEPARAALGRTLLDFMPASARDNCAALLRPVLRGELTSSRHELPLAHADGPLRWVELRLWRDPDHPDLIGGTLVDITQRVQEARFRNIQATALENTVNGVVITDNTRPGQPIVWVNRGFTRIAGYAPEEALGRSCSFLQGEDREQPGVQQMREAIARCEPTTVLLRNYRKDGTLFWNQIELSPIHEPLTGAVTHFFGLQTDVTLQHEAELQMQARACELERLFDGSPLGIVTVDARQCVKVVSPAFERLTGLSASDITGRPLAHLTRKLATLCQPGEAAPAWPAAGQVHQWRLQRPRPCVVEATATASAFGEESVVFFRDVSLEVELGRVKTQFLATAAHELRAPMGSIRGFTELLLLREYPREESREMLETVHRQALRLNALLSDLLDLTKLEAQGPNSFPLGPVGLAEVMGRAAKLLFLPGGPRQLVLEAPAPQVHVHGHAAKLEQVLINLLSNAVKYSPGGGEIGLRCTAGEGSRAGWWRLSVQDQGLGLSAEHQARLFTRFFRADPNSAIPGTGLGLVIVKELVERMGGQVEVHSQLGQGSRFSVWLREAAPAPARLTV